MTTHSDNTLDNLLEKVEKRTRSARLLSIVLTIIPLVIAVLFLVITLKQIQNARTELIAANEDLNRVAEETGRLRIANDGAKAQLETTKNEIDSAIDKLSNTLEMPLPANARAVVKDAIARIRGANTTLSEAKADLDTANRELSSEPRRSRHSFIVDLFSDQPATRLRAYNGVMTYYSTDAALIPELLEYARDHPDNANGTYNTLVVLSHLNKEQLRPHITQIEAFAKDVKPMGPKIEERVERLVKRLPEASAKDVKPVAPKLEQRVEKLLKKVPK
jgi:chromosome segregation ATPase